MKNRLTKCETRAREMMEEAKARGSMAINVDWVKSRTWGQNPVIKYHGEKCTNISGCGYDKLSAALSEVLGWLFPYESTARREMWSVHGAGERTVIETLARHGWELNKLAEGPSYDCYMLKMKGESNAS